MSFLPIQKQKTVCSHSANHVLLKGLGLSDLEGLAHLVQTQSKKMQEATQKYAKVVLILAMSAKLGQGNQSIGVVQSAKAKLIL
jgi:hypothetical protein